MYHQNDNATHITYLSSDTHIHLLLVDGTHFAPFNLSRCMLSHHFEICANAHVISIHILLDESHETCQEHVWFFIHPKIKRKHNIQRETTNHIPWT